MYQPERMPHWVKRNETVRVPRRFIYLHSVARSRNTRGGQVKTWGVTVATFAEAAKGRPWAERTTVFHSVDTLWDEITAYTRENARTVLWAHNLGVDARLTDCLHILSQKGWTLTGHNMAPRGTWFAWRSEGKTLVMVDIAAVFPTLLPEIGKAFGIGLPKKALPGESAEHALERAKAGELIIRTAARQYLAWIEKEELGNWQFTGAGQSYAAFRHKHLTHKMLVHDDQGALAMERAAMWTGRCEAWWHGTILRQNIHEWDFTSAYASICKESALPVKLVGPMPPKWPWRHRLDDPKVALVARVTVDTPEPVVPCRHGGRILWPVGRFETVLWDVEIAEVIKAGGDVTVHEGYLYRKEPALKQWAEWILGILSATDPAVTAWQKMIAKHHSTALVGRFGMTYPEWEELATSRTFGVDRRACVDLDTGEHYDVMQIGRQIVRQGSIVEWPNSMPAITGYVMASARVKLWRLLRALPPKSALYVDTDSILVPDQFEPTMAALATTPEGHGLRLKKSWDGIGIYGPRQLITGPKVRMSGVPVSARRIDRHTFAGEVWESLEVALKHRRSDRIVTRDRIWHARGVDQRRIGPALGWTQPYTIGREQ